MRQRLCSSEHRTSQVLNQPRSTQRYVSRRKDDDGDALRPSFAWPNSIGRYGYRKITAFLRIEGWQINHKKVDRKFKIIGEALNRLHQAYPEIAERIPPLREIVDFRNLLIHGYAIVIPDRVWDYAENHVPQLAG